MPWWRVAGVNHRSRRADAIFAYRITACVAGRAAASSGALAMAVPPSLDTGETTDKGSLNSRFIPEKRRLDVDRLYEGRDSDVIVVC